MTRTRIRSLTNVLAILVAAVPYGACVRAPRWLNQNAVSPELVARSLGETGATLGALRPEDIAAPPVRVHTRPCCAFGTHLQASLGPIPVPLFSMGNIRSVDDLGPHTYDTGAIALRGSSTKSAFKSENNGLVYTCRGGFIDTAHVRDYADWTVFWAATIARSSVSGATVELPLEGGKRRVIIRPLPTEIVERYGLRRTAVGLAQWLAFQLSIWHEIATAYGWASIELYPEYLSAFSPEDLYSNLLGIKIAGGILMQTGSAATDSRYDQSMDQWLQATLRYLHPVPADAGAKAMYLVDGVWWDSKARLPDPRLVLRRNFDAGNQIAPWQISKAYRSEEMNEWLEKECGVGDRPVILQRSDSARGIRFADLLTLEIDVDVKDPFPFPRTGSTQITEADFPEIIGSVRQKALRALGSGSDHPERDAH